MIKIVRYTKRATVTITIDKDGNISTKVEPP